MAGPWEKYASDAQPGPWTKYGGDTPGAFSRFAGAALEGADSIVDAGKMLFGNPAAAMRTGQRIQSLAQEPARVAGELNKSGAAMAKADLPGAAYHLAGAVPVVGGAAQQVSEDFGKGDYATGFGHALNLLAPFVAPEAALALEKAAPGIGRVLTAAKEGVKAATPDVAAGAGKIAVGAAVGEALPAGPARHYAAGALSWPGAHQVYRGIGKGLKAGREALNPAPPPPAPPVGLADEFGLPVPEIPAEAIGTPAAPAVPQAATSPAPPVSVQSIKELSDALNGELAKDAPAPKPAKAPRDYAAERRGVKVDAFVQHLKDKGVTADLANQGIPIDKWWDDVTGQVNGGSGSRFGTPSLKSRQQIVEKLRALEAEEPRQTTVPPVQPYSPGAFFNPSAIQRLIDLQERGIVKPPQ